MPHSRIVDAVKTHARDACDGNNIILVSDNGLFTFNISLAARGQVAEGGIGSGVKADDHGGASLQDWLHIFLAAVSGYVPPESAGDQAQTTRHAFLRRAVGVTNATATLPFLDPRQLFPVAVDIITSSVSTMGMPAMLDFVSSRGLLQLTSNILPQGPVTQERDIVPTGGFVAAAANAWKRLVGTSQDIPVSERGRVMESLLPANQNAYVTLGSDKDCAYLNAFLRLKPAMYTIF